MTEILHPLSPHICTIPDTLSPVTIYLYITWYPCHLSPYIYTIPETLSLVTIYLYNCWVYRLSPYICTIPDTLSLVTIYLHNIWRPITCHHMSVQCVTPYHLSPYYLHNTWHSITCHHISVQYLTPYHLSLHICTIPNTLSLFTIYLYNTWVSITCHHITAQYHRLYHLSKCICTISESEIPRVTMVILSFHFKSVPTLLISFSFAEKKMFFEFFRWTLVYSRNCTIIINFMTPFLFYSYYVVPIN
jgi:hypothetical protein